jgi:hypothetical protein
LESVSGSNLKSWSIVGLSVIGAHWGEFGLSPRVRVGESDSIATFWTSDTIVFCKLSPGYHASPQIVATLSGHQSTLSNMLSYDLPGIFLTQVLRSSIECEVTEWGSDTSVRSNVCQTLSLVKDSIQMRLRIMHTQIRRGNKRRK